MCISHVSFYNLIQNNLKSGMVCVGGCEGREGGREKERDQVSESIMYIMNK